MTSLGTNSLPGVGTPEHAASLLTDLYVRLRFDLKRWASVTHQTPQPRMGYVGQHLVSAVTGFPGGRSGARGDDLKLPDGKVGEIKCCYRVDQLGKCRRCGTAVASIEKICPNTACLSVDLERRDDSKWLLAPKTEQELHDLFIPDRYYFVLFEFVDIQIADDIDVLIYEVDPLSLGFSLCMIDYFFNIRRGNPSAAPFNLWPHVPKFSMMKPRIIYKSVIKADDTIETKIFPGLQQPTFCAFGDLEKYSRATTLSEAAIDQVAIIRRSPFPDGLHQLGAIARKTQKLALLQSTRIRLNWDDESLADDFARAVYGSKLTAQKEWTDRYAPGL